MRIGIIGAMHEEIELLKNDLDIKEEKTIGKRDYLCGYLYGKDVVLVFSPRSKFANLLFKTTKSLFSALTPLSPHCIIFKALELT